MKILKYIGYSLLSLIILFIVLAFVLPTEQHISATRTIDASKRMVFNAINDLNAHNDWSPFKESDKTMTFTINENSIGKGAAYTWTSENQGNGSYKIIESDPETGIKTDVKFENRGGGNGTFLLENNEGKTNVTWNFDFDAGRFTNVLMPFIKIGMKKTFNKGLENLDAFVLKRKNKAEYFGLTINEEIIPLQYFATIRSEVPSDKVEQFFASNQGQLFTAIQSADVEMVGKPCKLIYNFNANGQKIDLATAIPINKEVNISDATLEMMPAGKAAKVDYYGDINNISKAHSALQAYLSDRELVHDWPVMEVTVTDPAIEQDPTKWLTEIYYPIGN